MEDLPASPLNTLKHCAQLPVGVQVEHWTVGRWFDCAVNNRAAGVSFAGGKDGARDAHKYFVVKLDIQDRMVESHGTLKVDRRDLEEVDGIGHGVAPLTTVFITT